MAIGLVRDVFGQVITAVEKLQNIEPPLSDEQIAAVQEVVTAQYWAGYELGYTSAKQGDPNIAELVTSARQEEREEVRAEETEEHRDFGDCPKCGQNDGYLNVSKTHWFVCHQHKTKWCIGFGLFSSWQEETEETWQKNAQRLEGYHLVKPRL